MLLLDVGNTRLKWARVHAAEMGPVEAQVHGGQPLSLLSAIPVGADRIWLASVMGSPVTTALVEALEQRGAQVQLARVPAECAGLRVAYREPGRLGVDRWLGMLGLWTRLGTAFQVVSAGTALTFDAVNAQGQHLGGFIAPGIRAMEKATLGSTRFETTVLPVPTDLRLGVDTEQCVVQGALHAAVGAVERAAQGGMAPGFIAGGDAALLQAHLRGDWQLVPDLVLEGLLALAAQAD